MPGQVIITWLRQRLGDAPQPPHLHTAALVLIESMSAYHSMRRTFGRTLGALDDERFIEGWSRPRSPSRSN